MSRRLLCLTLALVMLMMALPLLTLSSLAGGDTLSDPNLTVNFRVGAAYDEATLTTAHGEIIKTKTWAEILADPTLLNPDVGEESPIAWVYWNAEAKKYTSLGDFFCGIVDLPEAKEIDVYPIMRTTCYLDGLPIISAADNDNDPETPDLLTLEMYRSGWTFNTPHKTSGMLLMTIEQGTKKAREWYRGYLQAWAGDRAPLHGSVLQNGDILLGHNSAGYKEYAVALSWQAPLSGKYTVTLPKTENVQLLVCVNGICVLGAEEQIGQSNPALNSIKDQATGIAPENADWFTFGLATDEGYDALTDKTVTVTPMAGEKIDIIIKRNYPADAVPPKDMPARDDQWLKGWTPTIEHIATYEAPTGVAAAPSLGSTLSVDFEAILPEGDLYADLEGGVLVNGKDTTSISLAPADADVKFTVQPYYTVDADKRILGQEKTYTFNELMFLYVGSDYESLAKAALHYTAAFEALFGNGNIPIVPAFTGTYNDKMGVVDYTGDGEVTIVGASLTVNEKIGIKLVVRDLPEGAKLQIGSDKHFKNILNAAAGTMTATSDNTGHKYIMDGISIANFDTIYYFRVVNAEGKSISDTVQYSVSTYCTRMANSANLKLTALVNAMMGVYEAGIAAN